MEYRIMRRSYGNGHTYYDVERYNGPGCYPRWGKDGTYNSLDEAQDAISARRQERAATSVISEEMVYNSETDYENILKAIPDNGIFITDLGRETGLSTPDLIAALTLLEINGKVRSVTGGCFLRTDK